MDSVAERRVKAQFEAMLLEPLLAPFESAFGEAGGLAAPAFSQLLASMLERHG